MEFLPEIDAVLLWSAHTRVVQGWVYKLSPYTENFS